MNKVTIGVVGCGRIAQGAHFPALTKIEGVNIKYICDLIPEKMKKVKETYPDLKAIETTDYNDILRDPEVQAVYVLTPNYAHYQVSMDALKAGKNVFCEKPITVNYALSCEMAEEAKKAGKLLNIGVCNRYHKSVERIKEMYEKGELGDIYHVYCSFRSFRSIPGLGGAFTTKSQSGGGVLIDWGVHFLDLILYILGQPKLKTVSADTYSEMAKDMKTYKYRNMWAEDTKDVVNGTNDVDDFITGYVRTDKASISINGAWAQNLDIKEMFVDFLGDKGGVRLDYGKLITVTRGDTILTEHPEYEIPDMYRREDEDFLNCVLTGEKNRNYIDNVLNSALILDALYKSADEHKELAL